MVWLTKCGFFIGCSEYVAMAGDRNIIKYLVILQSQLIQGVVKLKKKSMFER